MNKSLRTRTGHFEQGFTMFEMLIALLILSIGLLGIAGLQSKGQQANYEAYVRTQATMMAYELMDRIRLNPDPDGTGTGAYATADLSAETMTTDCDAASCDKVKLRAYDLVKWRDMLAERIPGGVGTVTTVNRSSDGIGADWRYQITITWDLKTAEQDTVTGADTTKSAMWEFTP